MRHTSAPISAIDTAFDQAGGTCNAFNFRHRRTLRPFHALMAGIATEVLVDLGTCIGRTGGQGGDRHGLLPASGRRALRRRARIASSLTLMASWR
jgi:hypothetical protein